MKLDVDVDVKCGTCRRTRLHQDDIMLLSTCGFTLDVKTGHRPLFILQHLTVSHKRHFLLRRQKKSRKVVLMRHKMAEDVLVEEEQQFLTRL